MAAIEVAGVSKGYPLEATRWQRLRSLLRPRQPVAGPMHWALRDVSFEVPAGSTLGVIGDNGAGKSTLLGVVAGIVQPTHGTVRLQGRVATLMELGAGFNPDFTGRENVLMGGAVLGLRRSQLNVLLPDIESFAELGEFLDRPVKTYSAGMYVRLAFALATSVDPDILVVDEVLAVGDQYFQKKCVDRIAAFRRAGKTLVFCSHHLYYVRQMCDRAVWLHEGRVAGQGPAEEVVDAYQTYLRARQGGAAAAARRVGAGAQPAEVTEVRITDERGAPHTQFSTGDTVWIRVRFRVDAPGRVVHVGVHIARNDQVECVATGTHFSDVTPAVEGTRGSVALRLKQLPLLAGLYHVSVGLLDEHGLHIYDLRHSIAELVVTSGRRESGVFLADYEWVTPDVDAG
jgi:ABC-type polysaccharide/polyol phosphate transport system ATPase subunit